MYCMCTYVLHVLCVYVLHVLYVSVLHVLYVYVLHALHVLYVLCVYVYLFIIYQYSAVAVTLQCFTSDSSMWVSSSHEFVT